MDSPQSSVLERVKLFLPQIEKANRELETAVLENGAESVRMDSTLVETTSSTNEEDAAEKSPSETQVPVVNLEFAIGDFDGTPIATAEDNAEDYDVKLSSVGRSSSGS